MSLTDACGLPVTIEGHEVRDTWDRTVRAFLAHGRTTPHLLSAVLEAEPRFALGHAARGLFLMLLGRAELAAEARAALRAARRAQFDTGATRRERLYADALAAWLDGRPSTTTSILSEILVAHPEDALAMKLDHAVRFVLGDRRGMEAMTRRVLPAYGEEHPFSGYALGCRAFALEENGHYAAAERAGREALAKADDDAWGLHAVAHVYDMTARNADGIAWLSGQERAWAHCNNFGYHVWWHLALFHLDRGEFDRVLALYDSRVRADRTDDYRDIANAASLLVRLEIEGVHVGARWDELAALSAGRVEDGCVVFADLHYLLALEQGDRPAEAARLIDRLAEDAQRSDHDMHEVAAVAGHPAALGLAAWRAGRYDLAFDRLRAVRPALGAIGGSHAQRDVFSRLAVEAGIRAARLDEAEAELADRARRRGAEDGFTARRREAIAAARGAACTTLTG